MFIRVFECFILSLFLEEEEMKKQNPNICYKRASKNEHTQKQNPMVRFSSKMFFARHFSPPHSHSFCLFFLFFF